MIYVCLGRPGNMFLLNGCRQGGRVRLSKPVDLGDVKEGSYVLIDGEPCKIVEVEKSKPGK
jgi:hypothetical protein